MGIRCFKTIRADSWELLSLLEAFQEWGVRIGDGKQDQTPCLVTTMRLQSLEYPAPAEHWDTVNCWDVRDLGAPCACLEDLHS